MATEQRSRFGKVDATQEEFQHVLTKVLLDFACIVGAVLALWLQTWAILPGLVGWFVWDCYQSWRRF